MTIELVTAIALWCGQPFQYDGSFYNPYIEACRSSIISCINKTKSSDKIGKIQCISNVKAAK